MRLIVLTSVARGTASRVLPSLCANQNLEIKGVVFAHGVTPNKKKSVVRKLRKIIQIGLLGAINGVRMRKWYADREANDIRKVCSDLGVALYETDFINTDATRALFRDANADLGISLANGYIAPSVFSIPKHGMINLHTEILPRFRGAQSVIWPIYENVGDTGFTIHQIDRKIDRGEILYQERLKIRLCPTLRETVETNLEAIRVRVPEALSYVCENYSSLQSRSQRQESGRSYTTPSIWQFLRMLRNRRLMYRSRSDGP